MQTLGIIGAGRLGTVIARLAVAAGYAVSVSSRRAAFSVPVGARAVAIPDSEVVVLALPLGQVAGLRAMEGRVVVDATNYWWAADGIRPEFSDPRTSTSELVQSWLPGARVVKGLGHMGYHDLEDEARPPGAPGRRGIAYAGDDARAVALVGELIDALGFDPVYAGALAEGVRFEPDTELFGADVSADEVRAMLARFPSSARGRGVARARAAGR
jgi:predicted dinucleotide-binding enzyme